MSAHGQFQMSIDINPRVVSKAEATALVMPRSRVLYRAFPYNEAALLLTNGGSAG